MAVSGQTKPPEVNPSGGANWDVQAEMDYNGVGQRLSMGAGRIVSMFNVIPKGKK